SASVQRLPQRPRTDHSRRRSTSRCCSAPVPKCSARRTTTRESEGSRVLSLSSVPISQTWVFSLRLRLVEVPNYRTRKRSQPLFRMLHGEETMRLFKRILQKKKLSFSDFFCFV